MNNNIYTYDTTVFIQMLGNCLILPQLNIMKRLFMIRQNSLQPLGRKSALSLALIRLSYHYPYAIYSNSFCSSCKHRHVWFTAVSLHKPSVMTIHDCTIILKFEFNMKMCISGKTFKS